MIGAPFRATRFLNADGESIITPIIVVIHRATARIALIITMARGLLLVPVGGTAAVMILHLPTLASTSGKTTGLLLLILHDDMDTALAFASARGTTVDTL